MPEPVPPPPIPEFDVASFLRPLDASTRSNFAKLMGQKAVPEVVVKELECLIATYRAQVNENVGATSTTVASSIAAIDQQLCLNTACVKNLGRFTNTRSGIDEATFDALNPQSLAIQQAIEAFGRAARNRKTQLEAHDRVKPATEALKYFCAMLRHFYEKHARLDWRLGSPGRRRKFALAVLTEVGVERTDFINHPKRLDEYLDCLIPLQDLPPQWVQSSKSS
jgi:hypothetical protein